MHEIVKWTAKVFGKTKGALGVSSWHTFEIETYENASREELMALAYDAGYEHLSQESATFTPKPEKSAATTRRLTARERELLALIAFDEKTGAWVADTSQRIPDWSVLTRLMADLGARWVARKGFRFLEDEGPETMRLALEHGEVVDWKGLGFFPTPDRFATELVARSTWSGERAPRVLEPSAGNGALVRAVKTRWPSASVKAWEILAAHEVELRKAGAEVTIGDFLKCKLSPFWTADLVVMNPPFAGRADAAHIAHAMKFVRPGGELLAIASAGMEFSTVRSVVEVREALAAWGAEWSQNPEGLFKAAGTMVRTVSIRAKRPRAL